MIGTNAFTGKNGLHVAHAACGEHRMVAARSDALAHKLLFVALIPVFLPAAAVRRALPAAPGKTNAIRRSVFEEAKVAASTASAYAFMG